MSEQWKVGLKMFVPDTTTSISVRCSRILREITQFLRLIQFQFGPDLYKDDTVLFISLANKNLYVLIT